MKKEVQGMTAGAIIMLSLAIISLFGIAIIEQVGETQKINTAYTNDTFTGNNVTAQALTHDEIVTSLSYSVYNASNSSQLLTETTEYVLNSEAGTILIVGSTWNGTSLASDYYYQADSDVTTVSVLFVAGLTVFATFSSLVSLIIVGMIIMKLIKKSDE